MAGRVRTVSIPRLPASDSRVGFVRGQHPERDLPWRRFCGSRAGRAVATPCHSSTPTEPNVVDLIVDFGLEVIWHPSLGMELGANAQRLFRDCATGERPMDVFVFEGSVIEAPNGPGGWTCSPTVR